MKAHIGHIGRKHHGSALAHITTAHAVDHQAQVAIGLSGQIGQSNNADVGNPGGHQAVAMGATGGGCIT